MLPSSTRMHGRWRVFSHLPEFGADLVSTLARLDVHDLTHGGRLPARCCKSPGLWSWRDRRRVRLCSRKRFDSFREKKGEQQSHLKPSLATAITKAPCNSAKPKSLSLLDLHRTPGYRQGNCKAPSARHPPTLYCRPGPAGNALLKWGVMTRQEDCLSEAREKGTII